MPAASTTLPPPYSPMNAAHWAAPCINGAAGSIVTIPEASAFFPTCSGVSGGGPYGLPPIIAAKKRSSWRHITPFGMPVVPPVYRMYRSSAERGPKSRSGEAAASASS